MKSQRDRRSSRPFFLGSTDSLGRQIDPAVLSAATEIGPRAVSYAERVLGDSAVAMNLFEEAATAVTQAVEQKRVTAKPQIQNLPGYLFRTFVRLVAAEQTKRNQERQLITGDIERFGVDDRARLHAGLLLNEVLATCDKVSREITIRRLEGFSWDEIAEEYGISSHTARNRFSRTLQRARKALNKPRRPT
jgi:RNA polymerase sigma factor (sigma-70 family)